MTKKTFKNRINKILTDNTKGIFSDQYWQPVQATWKALQEAGYFVSIGSTAYQHNADGIPVSKNWMFTVEAEGYVVQGILTAHGAGSIQDPLDRYDISAYCC